ncbi:unnamed protein product [Lactuca virosa]|uniref:Uncharacterized protein n=1 Tax=Lactuca virosa TaxID=75947 RepID=A0AAU9LQY5_9ASTR|nr:unnamed protein product [Lactuca virosa]
MQFRPYLRRRGRLLQFSGRRNRELPSSRWSMVASMVRSLAASVAIKNNVEGSLLHLKNLGCAAKARQAEGDGETGKEQRSQRCGGRRIRSSTLS